MCYTLLSANTFDAKQCAAQTTCSASLILSHITNNLGSSGGKTFLQNLRWCPFKISKNIQHHNTKAHAIDRDGQVTFKK
jgi:hypothetical protein